MFVALKSDFFKKRVISQWNIVQCLRFLEEEKTNRQGATITDLLKLNYSGSPLYNQITL